MKINNNTTTWQVAELMGDLADERDGRYMMAILSRECVVDTSSVSDDQWAAWVDEAAATRRAETE